MEAIWRRLPKDFKLPDFLTEDQKEEIILARKNNTPIIICGEQGPTGKTTLAKYLKENGFIVYEEWECLKVELNKKLY